MEFINTKKPKEYNIINVINSFNSGVLHDNDCIKLFATIHRIRKMSGFAFVILRDDSTTCQCIWEENNTTVNLDDFSLEEAVVVEGVIKVEKRSRLGFDINIVSMQRISGKAQLLPIEISNNNIIDNLNLNTLLDNRILSIRNPKIKAILKITDGILFAFRNFLRNEGFTEFVAPKIVQAGAEGGADMFEVDYFGQKAYLNQSPQMYKQIMVGTFHKVFTIGPVFRAEKYSTNRHINEFQGLDIEMSFINSIDELMALEARMFKYIFEVLNTQYLSELQMYIGKNNKLPTLTNFPKIKFNEAKALYANAHPEIRESVLSEPDFSPEEEKWIGKYFLDNYNSPLVFITHYPTSKRPFYTKEDPSDPTYTLSFDVLLNGLEITTGGQRIHDYKEQINKMKRLGMNIDNFEDYLTMHKYGMPPHGGMGLGLERIVQNILGLENVKQATAFPRDRDRLRP